jgi:hypothetical protein
MASATAAAASPRLEPLLWVQLIGLGALPLEGLLLLLLLAGNDPGPVPELERVLCWSLGGLGPMLLLWRRPADPWSLLFIQTPLRGRRELQQRLSSLQEATPLRLALAFGAAIELPLLWWVDRHAAVVGSLTPFDGTPRLLGLLVAALLLALMLWQWQQMVQAVWLISRDAAAVEAASPLKLEQLEQGRLSLGLPLLLPDPLQAPTPPPGAPSAPPAPAGASEVESAAGPEAPEAEAPEASTGAVAAIPVEPEQPPEEKNGPDLEDQVG